MSLKFEALATNDKFHIFKILICLSFAIITLLISVLSSSWIITKGYNAGLWKACQNKAFKISDERFDESLWFYEDGCFYTFNLEINLSNWRMMVLVLMATSMLCLILSISFFTLTMIILNSYIYLNATLSFIILSNVFSTIGLIIYPIKIHKVITLARTFDVMFQKHYTGTKWEIGWSYGVAWASVIFSLGAIIAICVYKRMLKQNNGITWRKKLIQNEDSLMIMSDPDHGAKMNNNDKSKRQLSPSQTSIIPLQTISTVHSMDSFDSPGNHLSWDNNNTLKQSAAPPHRYQMMRNSMGNDSGHINPSYDYQNMTIGQHV